MIDEILKSDIRAIKKGYIFDPIIECYQCLICGTRYEVGEIFTFDERMFEASRAIKEHIKRDHQGVLNTLLDLDKHYTGLTEKQNALLKDFASGLSDKAIAKKNGVAASTVRHQKFMLREKAKQAKMYLAIFESVEDMVASGDQDVLVQVHAGATMVDERYLLTLEENDKILKNYFLEGPDLKLKTLPSKEKKKIAVLRKITQAFDPDKKYSEFELNDILKKIYDDIATIRRYLIQYGFFDRTKDCSQYWIKK